MMVEMVVSNVAGSPSLPGSPVAGALLVVSLFAAAAVGAWFLRACWKTRTLMDAVEAGARLLLLYLLLVTALLRTSYLVWVVGLAAVVASIALRRAVAVFSCSVMALEVVWVWRLLLPEPPPSQNAQRFVASAVAVGVPILYLLLHSRGWPMRWLDRWRANEGETA